LFSSRDAAKARIQILRWCKRWRKPSRNAHALTRDSAIGPCIARNEQSVHLYLRCYIGQVVISEIIVTCRLERRNAKIISSSKFDIANILLVIIKWKTNLRRDTFRWAPRENLRAIMETAVCFPPSPPRIYTWQIQYSSDKRLEIGRNGECTEIWSRAERKLKELDTLCVLLGSHSERQVLWATWSCPRHLSLFSSRTWFPYSERTLSRAMRLLPHPSKNARLRLKTKCFHDMFHSLDPYEINEAREKNKT